MRNLLVIVTIIFLFLVSCTNQQITGSVVATNNFIEDRGVVELFFCPQEHCEENLNKALEEATISLHCAFYDIGLLSIQETLKRKAQSIEVLVVMDDDYLKKFNESFVRADKSGLMHNKFCIIDSKKVTTGSMNPTPNDANKNNNNLLIFSSKVISQNYEDEFNELWQGTFKKGVSVKVPQILLDKSLVEVYFCPEDNCAYRTKEALKNTQQSIYFMTFSFTHEGIANILLLKNAEGINVKGVVERRQTSEYSQHTRLQDAGVDVQIDGNKNTMHHKVFIIDEEIVVTGSFNPTEGGDTRNDENLVIIKDKEIAKRFVAEFEKVYGESTIVNVMRNSPKASHPAINDRT